MRQMLHIFKKDIRGLWGELAVFLCCLVLACWSFPFGSAREGRFDLEGSWAGEVLVLMAGCYLIARLIHAEAIPGSTQFWITRPYRWPSLLGAKMLFILVCAHVPVFVAQAVLLSLADFPVWANLAGLFWTQVLMLACVSLPAAGIAAVTRGLAGFSLVTVVGLASGLLLALVRNYAPAAALSNGSLYEVIPSHINGFVWATYAILAVALAAAALSVLVAQYSKRKTFLSRALLFGISLTGVALSLFGGPGLAWPIQALASRQSLNTMSFQFSLGRPTFMAATNDQGFVAEWPPASFETTHVEISLPLLISGMTPGSDVGTENVSLSFESADGETRGSHTVEVTVFRAGQIGMTSGGELHVPLIVQIGNGKFFEKLRNSPSTVRGYIDLFRMGNERSLTVPGTSFPVNVTNAFRCGLENMRPGKPFSKDLSCRVAFRWPLESIDVNGGSFVKAESFSPFPANLRLNPILYRYPAFWLSESDRIDFKVREPVSYVRREFEIHNVQLMEGPETKRGWRPGQ